MKVQAIGTRFLLFLLCPHLEKCRALEHWKISQLGQLGQKIHLMIILILCLDSMKVLYVYIHKL